MRPSRFALLTRRGRLATLALACSVAFPVHTDAARPPAPPPPVPPPLSPVAGLRAPAPPAAPPILSLEGSGVDAWALLADGSRWLVDVGRGELARVEAERRAGEPILWFRKGGREYLVRDGELLRQLRGALDRRLDGVRAQAAQAARQVEAAGEAARVAAELAERAAERAHDEALAAVAGLERRLRPLEEEIHADLEVRLEEMAKRLEAEAARLEELYTVQQGHAEELAHEGERRVREAEGRGEEIGRRLGERLERAIESGEAEPLD